MKRGPHKTLRAAVKEYLTPPEIEIIRIKKGSLLYRRIVAALEAGTPVVQKGATRPTHRKK